MAESSKRVLRPHKKTRAGCYNCKTRRVKCDLVKPCCGACSRRLKLDVCPYPDAEPSPSSSSQSSSHAESSAQAQAQALPFHTQPSPSSDTSPEIPKAVPYHPRSISSNSGSRAMELQLFQFFLTNTSKRMPYDRHAPVRNIWRVLIPRAAFDHDFVFDAVLSTACVHVLTLDSSNQDVRRALLAINDRYFARYQAKVREMDEGNMNGGLEEPLLLASIMTNFCVSLRGKYNDVEHYNVPIGEFRTHVGVRTLYECVKGRLAQDSPIHDWVRVNMESVIERGVDLALLEPRARDDFSMVLNAIAVSDYSDEDKCVLRRSLEVLSTLVFEFEQRGLDEDLLERVLSFPWSLPAGFPTLLDKNDPLLMVIFARYHAITAQFDDPWWMIGTGSFELLGTKQVLSEEWAWGLEWPLEILKAGGYGS